MRRILFLFACLVAVSTTAKATTSSSEAETSLHNFVRGYGNSFIFVEGGIEFAVFPDGQFDFYAQNFGPDVSVGINTPGFSFSFNSGFDYNPYVQYDSFGAVIQIENTPIFYDFYGRVSQIGNIFINYNRFGRVARIGGLNIFYRNNVFHRYTGFINIYNRAYVYRPWHRFYRIPPVNFCVINARPYRQFYTPVRHIYYRPYRNNVRFATINGRRGNNNIGRRYTNGNHYRRYAQTPRNHRERNIKRRVERNNAVIAKTRRSNRNDRIARVDHNRGNSQTVRSNNRSSNRTAVTNGQHTRRHSSATQRTNRSNDRVNRPVRTVERSQSNRVNRTGARKNVTKSRKTVSNKVGTQRNASVRKPNASNTRKYSKAKPQSKQRSVTQSKRKQSSVKSRPSKSRSSQKSTRPNTRRTRA